MKIKNLFSLAVLELTRYKSISLFLVLNLTMGLIGFFLLQVFQQSLSQQSAEKAQIILGGDLSINARRAFSDEERKKWESTFKAEKSTHFYTLFSMLRTSSNSKLVNVAVFDDNYPLYGQFRFSEVQGLTSDLPRIWVDPEIQEILELKINDVVEIGETQFTYSGFIVEDPSRLLRGAGFAPRVLIHQKYLRLTGLLKPGSTFSESWNYKIDPDSNLALIKARLENLIKDPVVNISTTKDSAEDSSRVLRYFTDYLGLVALVALGLCFLCGSYLLQWTFLSKKKTIAIYKTLGLPDEKIIAVYFLQNFMISLMACVLSVAVVQLIVPFLQQVLTQKFNLPLTLIFSIKALIVTCSIAIFGPMLIIVPQILQIIGLRPLMLLQNVDAGDFKKRTSYFIWLLLIIISFWLLSVWQSNSLKIASIFTGSLIGLIIFFQLMNRFVLHFLEKISVNFNWLIKYSVKGLTRKQASAALVFTTMSLSTLVLSLLPHVKNSIINEIKPEYSSQIPSLFMFDIQPEQVSGLQSVANKMLNEKLVLSPLVRSRILKINDINYERAVPTGELQTRESEDEARFRNRGINLTYRDHLQNSENTVAGVFTGRHNGQNVLPQISIEKRYAERIGVKIGDVMTFDVQGVELKAQVGSLRRVRWTSFQPNFFILFPEGVLEEAPQIFLTSISNHPRSLIKEFQKNVTTQFKNVSIIDLARTIENSLRYIDQMSLGLQFMAWLAVLVGILVFIVLLNTQIKERIQEMNLLQILGSTSRQILKIVLIQFLILITTSITFGVLLGLAMSWVIITFFFDIKTVFDGYYLLILCSILIPICAGALYLGLKPLKKLNPMDLIRQI